MTRVMAQGVFDVVHPGNLYYLRQSARLGDSLHVVVARDDNLVDDTPLLPEEARVEVVAGLDVVDEAVLGSTADRFASVRAVRPDVIALGYDQAFDEYELEVALREDGVADPVVVRIGEYQPDADEIVSPEEIKDAL